MKSRSDPVPPPDDLSVIRWSSWVAAGDTKESRAARLARVPAVMRESVRQEVIWWFQRIAYRSSAAGK